MTELERLQKEINGKVIWWKSGNDGKLLHAICLWPPDGEKVSIKPYGLTTEEIRSVCHWDSVAWVESSSYCFAVLKTKMDRDDAWITAKFIAAVPAGGVLDLFRHAETFGGNPSCPYG